MSLTNIPILAELYKYKLRMFTFVMWTFLWTITAKKEHHEHRLPTSNVYHSFCVRVSTRSKYAMVTALISRLTSTQRSQTPSFPTPWLIWLHIACSVVHKKVFAKKEKRQKVYNVMTAPKVQQMQRHNNS